MLFREGSSSALDALDVSGLHLDDAVIQELLKVDRSEWAREVSLIEEHYAQIGDSVPVELVAQLESLASELQSNV